MSANETVPTPVSTGEAVKNILDDYPDVDGRSCQLLGPTALIVQGLMGILVILSLVYKRHREKPKRPWRIWLFDVSKQIVGQMFVHGVNVFVSDAVSHNSDENACVLYFFNILIDTTLGVGLLYIILRVLTHLFVENFHLKGFESGIYGTPPSIKFWGKQATLYVVALTTMKLLVIALLAFFPGLFIIGAWLLSWTWTGDGDALQVIFTMGLFPIIMNILQFWLIDSIVKASNEQFVSLDTDVHDALDHADREPLFGVPSDDEDDDDAGTQRHDIENPRSPTHQHQRSQSNDKSTGGSTTPLASEPKLSGSSTPQAIPSETHDVHAYPPSLSSSVASASTMASIPASSIREATKLNKKRRSPPTPLHIRQPRQPAVNTASPAPKNPSHERKPSRPVVVVEPAGQEWTESWGDEDDWADRVGEEDWTGCRIEQKKDSINGVWDHSPIGAHAES
ncbi:vacuolar membrane protein-domain-containing protein [Desarmillaria tabescens]|uniref:Vacuolar membrane protein-domain-containing protein n=1 Tax=Armillaria tabescens TaxID=1929756 RepID=A0AA39TJU0_ARMTA|nr:vacuolar membrane protein-domain-containing protein [Desarmillaria tabescens]KAK0461652.1 vacuolar membrane protein-domain-containing protein [Desarmillaria tabescens]